MSEENGGINLFKERTVGPGAFDRWEIPYDHKK